MIDKVFKEFLDTIEKNYKAKDYAAVTDDLLCLLGVVEELRNHKDRMEYIETRNNPM